MPLAAVGAALWDFLKRIPSWVFFAFGALVIGKLYLEDQKNKAVERERQKQDVETGKERERVIETSHQIIEDIEDAKDAAIAAPDSVPVVSGPDELREQAPAIAEVILRNRR